MTPNRADIMRLAESNAYVGACVKRWHANELTWEQMLAAAVLALADVNQKLADAMTARLHTIPPKPEEKPQ